MKHSYTLSIPKTVDIAQELRANGYNFKGLNKAKLPATVTARISGKGSHFSGAYELFSPYGEYIAEYEKLRVNGKINDLKNLDMTINTNMDELWFGYQRLKNVKGNLNIKDNVVNISKIQNENLTASGKFDIKTGKIIPIFKEGNRHEKAKYTIDLLNLNDNRLCEVRKKYIFEFLSYSKNNKYSL